MGDRRVTPKRSKLKSIMAESNKELSTTVQKVSVPSVPPRAAVVERAQHAASSDNREPDGVGHCAPSGYNASSVPLSDLFIGNDPASIQDKTKDTILETIKEGKGKETGTHKDSNLVQDKDNTADGQSIEEIFNTPIAASPFRARKTLLRSPPLIKRSLRPARPLSGPSSGDEAESQEDGYSTAPGNTSPGKKTPKRAPGISRFTLKKRKSPPSVTTNPQPPQSGDGIELLQHPMVMELKEAVKIVDNMLKQGLEASILISEARNIKATIRHKVVDNNASCRMLKNRLSRIIKNLQDAPRALSTSEGKIESESKQQTTTVNRANAKRKEVSPPAEQKEGKARRRDSDVATMIKAAIKTTPPSVTITEPARAKTVIMDSISHAETSDSMSEQPNPTKITGKNRKVKDIKKKKFQGEAILIPLQDRKAFPELIKKIKSGTEEPEGLSRIRRTRGGRLALRV